MKEKTEKYIRFMLRPMMSQDKISQSIKRLDKYLAYIAEKYASDYSSLLDKYATYDDIDKLSYIKSFADPDNFLSNLASALKLKTDNQVWYMPDYLIKAFHIWSEDHRSSYAQEAEHVYLKIGSNYNEKQAEYHFLLWYYYRNKYFAHSDDKALPIEDISIEFLNRIISSTLFIMLYLVDKYNDDLEKLYNNKIYKQFDFDGYKQRIKNRYKQKGFEYLDVKWADEEGGKTIEEMIKNNKDGMIAAFIGEAGAGKTTALRRIEYIYAARTNRNFNVLPIFVELKTIEHGRNKLLRAISGILGTDEDFTRQILSEEGLVLLLDGINEVTNRTIAADIIKEVQELYLNNRNLHIYLTDRVNRSIIINVTAANISLYHLHALTLDNKKSYLKKNVNNDEARAFLTKELEDDSSKIIEVLNRQRTPLMLNILLNYINEYKSVPEDPVGSYIDKLFDRELREQKDADDPNAFEQLKFALAALADNYYDMPFNRFEGGAVIGRVREKMAYIGLDSSATLDLAVKMGLLEEKSDAEIAFANFEYANHFIAWATKRGIIKIIRGLNNAN